MIGSSTLAAAPKHSYGKTDGVSRNRRVLFALVTVRDTGSGKPDAPNLLRAIAAGANNIFID